MIGKPEVFDDAFLPVDLLHRETEIESLLHRFSHPNQNGSDMLVSGPSGVGKTVLTRKAVERLRDVQPVHHVHVDSLGKSTAGILRAVLEGHPAGPRSVPKTLSADATRDQLRDAVDERAETIVVLDEGDDLPETDAIGELRAMEGVTVVAIAHDATDWLARLDVDDAHQLDRGHLELGRYRVDELADILERRAREGLHGDVVTRQQLEEIADEVAGVARFGIKALYAAAEIADESGHYRIRQPDIDDCYQRARHYTRLENITSLAYHHQVLYGIVYGAGELTGEELHDRYDAISDEVYDGVPVTSITERSRRRKLVKLKEYDLIDYEGPTRSRSYWAVDRDVEPPIELPQSPTPP